MDKPRLALLEAVDRLQRTAQPEPPPRPDGHAGDEQHALLTAGGEDDVAFVVVHVRPGGVDGA